MMPQVTFERAGGLYSDGTKYRLRIAQDTHFDGNVVVKNGNELRFLDVGESHHVGFKAPALVATQVWTLPTSDGSSGQQLQTNGSGVLSWSAGGSSATFGDDALLSLGTGLDISQLLNSAGLAANAPLANVLIGTPVTQILAANSYIFGNKTANGDALYAINDGGTSRSFLHAVGATGIVTLGHGMLGAIIKTFSGVITLDPGGNALMASLAPNAPSPDTETFHVWFGTAGAVVSGIDSLVIESDLNPILQFLMPDDQLAGIRVGSPTDGSTRAGLVYVGAADYWQFTVDGGERLRVTIAGLGFQQATIISTTVGNLTLNPAGDIDANSNSILNIAASGNDFGAAQLDLAAGFTIQGAGDLNIRAIAGADVLIGDDVTILYVDGGSGTVAIGAASTGGATLEVTGGIRLITSVAGDTTLDFYQTTTQRAFLKYEDTADTFTIDADGPIRFQPGNAEKWRFTTVGELISVASVSNVTADGAIVATGGIAFTDVLNAWIDDATHGNGTVAHYIGNAQILVEGQPIGGTTPAAFTGTTLEISGRMLDNQGADVASTNNLVLGTDGNTFEITGTTDINLLSNLSWKNGSEVTLLFTSTATVKDAIATSTTNITILLDGSADFTASAGDTLTLKLCEIGGTQAWREIGRTVL